MSELEVAVIQTCPTDDYRRNLERAGEFISEAASQGARLLVLGEMFSFMGPPQRWRGAAQPAGGHLESFLSDCADRHGVYIVGGSYIEAGSDGAFHNTCPVVAPDGRVVGRYRKMHLFRTEIEGETSYDERSYLKAGEGRFRFDAFGFSVAVGICYDLRFPEFFRPRGGGRGGPADLFCLPAAFMRATGRAHWEVLVRARAIENLAFFAAGGTVGSHYEVPGEPGLSVETYGHSMVVSPWGEVLSSLEEGEGLLRATVTKADLATARGRLGALDHMRERLWG